VTAPIPSRVAVRMHQVGFGDCFLLTVTYPTPVEDERTERHILFDFGTMRLPTGWKDLSRVARSINERTQGRIDAVVVTHRHRDHLSAFGQVALAKLLQETAPPTMVLRPWTEAPDADERFTGEDGSPGASSRSFVRSLGNADVFASAVAHRIAPPAARGLRGDLHLMSFDQLSNPAAIDQLTKWAGPDGGEYLYYGQPTRLGSLLPGVHVRVMGPPTIEQHPDVARMRDVDHEEFWMLYRKLVGDGLAEDVRSEPAISTEGGASDMEGKAAPSGPVQWLIEHLDRQRTGSLLRIVRLLDDVLNNTSLILLFEIEGKGGTRRLLFPGDAQIENWEFALKPAEERTANLDVLAQVDLYKVGHHGSRNATPRTLFNLWSERDADRPITALMSTKDDVYGDSPATNVPRTTLVEALRTRAEDSFFDTRAFDPDQTFVEVSADLASSNAFEASGSG
jgi:hypothetical protein